MNQRATDTPEQVLKFAPKEKAPNRVAQLDDAGQAIVAQIRTAADLAKEDCDRAMSLAHKLSMELRAAEDRTQQMAREVEHWRDRAARAERLLWAGQYVGDVSDYLPEFHKMVREAGRDPSTLEFVCRGVVLDAPRTGPLTSPGRVHLWGRLPACPAQARSISDWHSQQPPA